MQVKPKLSVCLDCHTEKFSLSDATGPYHATLNPFGWALDGSASNIEISDVESSGLTITSPAGTVYGPYDVLPTLSLPSLGEVVVITPAVPEVLPITNTNAGSFSPVILYSNYPAPNTAITNTFQLQSGDSDNDTVYKLNVAFTAVASGFFAYNDGFNVRIQAPVGSGTIYNGRTLRITSSAGAIWFTFGTTGVNAVPAVTSTYLTSLEIDPTDILGTGEGEALSDGYWVFDWTVQGLYGNDDTPFHARCLKQVLALCAVECCVDGLVADADPSCGCSKTASKKSLNAFLTLAAIKARDAKKNREGAKSLLSKLQDICANNCKNC